MTTDQNPIKKPEQYKSLYEVTGNITDHNTMLVPLSALRTQYALLERALEVLGSARKVAYMGGAGTCDEMAAIDTTLADLTAHLEPK